MNADCENASGCTPVNNARSNVFHACFDASLSTLFTRAVKVTASRDRLVTAWCSALQRHLPNGTKLSTRTVSTYAYDAL